MPISIIGPRKMRKFEMKRKKTKIDCVQKSREKSAPQNPCHSAPAVPCHDALSPSASCTAKTTVTRATTRTTSRTSRLQNHDRRRATTSSSFSCRSSIPKRLGHGMSRRTPRSTSPRKARTRPAAPRTDQYHDQPTCRWNQRYAAGLVRTATKVVARERRRHCEASAVEDSPEARLGRRPSAVALFEV